MGKQITFTDNQRVLLEEILQKRIEQNYDLYPESCKPHISALNKIRMQNTDYQFKEKLAMISCIKEYYDCFNNEFKSTITSPWLAPLKDQKTIDSKLTICKEVLTTCGHINHKKSDREVGFCDYLSTIEKIKKTDTVFLSRNSENDYYKIAFVHNNKEFISFELKNNLSKSDFKFSFLGETSLEKFEKRFSFKTTKPKAKELLSACVKKNYPLGVLDFVSGILT